VTLDKSAQSYTP